MQIGELSEHTGISRDTLRYYEKRGLIRAHRRPNGYRHYPEETVLLLDFISTAKALGFSLSEIEAEIPEIRANGLGPERVAEVLTEKIEAIDRRISDLTRMRRALTQRLAAACPLMRAGKSTPADKA